MRKIILGIVLIFITLFGSFLGIGIIRKVHRHNIANENIAKFPLFTFLTLSNEKFNSSIITEGPALVMHFHPECDHCQWEIAEIFKSRIPDSFSHVLLVSSAHPDSIRKFLHQFNYFDCPSIIPLIDSSYDFEKIFGTGLVPSSYLYDSKLNLLKVFHGEVKTETILNLITKHE
jgi:hypothetical protein